MNLQGVIVYFLHLSCWSDSEHPLRSASSIYIFALYFIDHSRYARMTS